MRKLLMILPIVGLFVFSGLLSAGATQGDCATFENHSGHVPGSYDYAEFYEDGALVTTVQTNGQDIYVAPPAGRNSWDQVKKCQGTTTTTVADTTTTTAIETTTTTLPDTTTSSSLATTTTINPAPTTTAPTPPSTADDTLPIPSDAPELPFTGIGGTVGLLLAGAALLGLGVSTVRASKRIPE